MALLRKLLERKKVIKSVTADARQRNIEKTKIWNVTRHSAGSSLFVMFKGKVEQMHFNPSFYKSVKASESFEMLSVTLNDSSRNKSFDIWVIKWSATLKSDCFLNHISQLVLNAMKGFQKAFFFSILWFQ